MDCPFELKDKSKITTFLKCPHSSQRTCIGRKLAHEKIATERKPKNASVKDVYLLTVFAV